PAPAQTDDHPGAGACGACRHFRPIAHEQRFPHPLPMSTSSRKYYAPNPAKTCTGIDGFDEITHGGLPCGRTTLLVGGPGSGKTLFALRFLVHGAQECGAPGIFVAFEETSKRIVSNAEVFGWNLPALLRKKLFFLDAQPSLATIQSGTF